MDECERVEVERKFGVPVELNDTEGTMYGFDIVLDSPIAGACVDQRVAFLKRVFSAPARLKSP